MTAGERITETVASWLGVEAGLAAAASSPSRVGKREIGHLHGDCVLHAGFPKAVWHELYDAGRIDYHPVFPGKPGFAARTLESEDDVDDAIALLRLNYDRAVERHGAGHGSRTRRAPDPGRGAPGAACAPPPADAERPRRRRACRRALAGRAHLSTDAATVLPLRAREDVRRAPG